MVAQEQHLLAVWKIFPSIQVSLNMGGGEEGGANHIYLIDNVNNVHYLNTFTRSSVLLTNEWKKGVFTFKKIQK